VECRSRELAHYEQYRGPARRRQILIAHGSQDGSAGFDFEGTYTRIVPHKTIEYRIADGRDVKTDFVEQGDGVAVTTTFDTESTNPPEMQREGWQAILDNFRRHVEAKSEAV
jgi:uncharacterized protein YndB with AHSA1/START domain